MLIGTELEAGILKLGASSVAGLKGEKLGFPFAAPTFTPRGFFVLRGNNDGPEVDLAGDGCVPDPEADKIEV